MTPDKQTLIMLAFIILMALVIAVASTSFAWAGEVAMGHIEAGVCESCSVYYCNDCPAGIQEFTEATNATTADRQNYAIAAHNDAVRQKYCDQLQRMGKFMPDFCFTWDKEETP